MTDKMRWRYGETNPVVAAVNEESVIAIGDLLLLAVDDARPASAQDDQGSKAANQEQFARYFLGVAMQRSSAGESTPVRVATTGVFQFDCPADTYELGELVGLSENAEGNRLLNQQVEKVTAPQRAIGRVARREPQPSNVVLVDIRSTVMTGGVAGSVAPQS
jgi:hypothetical protein